ncbi:MAG: Mur ligase family protein [Pseudomonadota bacterium]
MGLHPKFMDLSLGRVERLLDALGRPQDALPRVVHVAGTNGKGSTLAMIRAGVEAAGLTTNVYTSPHLARFHERIRLKGRLIDEDRLLALLEACEAANGGEEITFFEITTAAALQAFADAPADVTLLETGLGGRLDATNVVARPELTAITPISMDHMQYLGDTAEKIAFEKAGILKRGTPCVVAPQDAGPMEVLEAQAARVGAPLIAAGQAFDAWAEGGRLLYQDQDGLLDLDPPNLPGAHQFANAGAAVAAMRALGLSEADCAAGVRGARWSARLQRLDAADFPGAPEGAEIWLDGGHNDAAGAALAEHMAGLQERRPASLTLIVGMLESKTPQSFLAHFQGLAHAVKAVEIPDAAASLPAEAIVAAARAAGLQAEAASSVEAAVASAPPGDGARAGEGPPRILICGSLYLAGWLLRRIGPPS